MKHLAAYLLLQQGGNASPSAKDVKAVLAAVGIEADDAKLDKVISELEGKDVNEVSRAMAREAGRAGSARSSTEVELRCRSAPRRASSRPMLQILDSH